MKERRKRVQNEGNLNKIYVTASCVPLVLFPDLFNQTAYTLRKSDLGLVQLWD